MPPSTLDLPAELWAQVFDLAADDDLIFQYGLQTSFSLHAWWKGFHGVWLLRSPREALNYIQKRSYFTKKAIVSTCRNWRAIGSESLFRYLFFDHPSKLLALCALLQPSSQLIKHSDNANAFAVNPKLCWWTRRIHVANRDHRTGIGMPALERALLQLLSYCPNLKILLLDFEWPMSVSLGRERTFGTVIDTLASTASKTLRTVHWHVPRSALNKIIWALDALPYLVAVHIHLSSTSDNEADHEEEEDAESDSTSSLHLGAAASLRLTLPYLQQLSLKGSFQDFLEQAAEWSLPSLSSLSLDSAFIRSGLTSSISSSNNSAPDRFNLLTFLLANAHGTTLRLLDLQCIPGLPVSRILDACPNLTAFAFNADWRLMPTSTDGSAAELVRVPHTSIRTIGLHGLLYAFDVGIGAAAAANGNGASGNSSSTNMTAKVIRRSNDLNVAALTRRNFPRLERVRVLSPVVLRDLERENGPSGEGVSRYNRWWSVLRTQRIRLEDCTGAELGTLPMDEDEEGDDEDEDEMEAVLEIREERADGTNSVNVNVGEDDDAVESDSDESAYESAEETFTYDRQPERQSPPSSDSDSESNSEDDEEEVANNLGPAKKHVNELLELLAECRAMEETRESLPYTSLMSASAPVPPGVAATVRRASGQVDYSAIYQHFTGNGSRRVSSGSYRPANFRPLPNDAARLRSQGPRRGRNRPRVSFGISDDYEADEAGRLPPNSPALSEGTLLGFADASPAVSSNATLIGEDEFAYGPGYGYGYVATNGQGQRDDEDEEDDEEEEEEDELEEEEDHHPVTTLRKLVEECRAMRENREESSFDFTQMMFGGPGMSIGIGMQGPRMSGYGNLGYGMPSRHSYQNPRGSYHEGSASTSRTR